MTRVRLLALATLALALGVAGCAGGPRASTLTEVQVGPEADDPSPPSSQALRSALRAMRPGAEVVVLGAPRSAGAARFVAVVAVLDGFEEDRARDLVAWSGEPRLELWIGQARRGEPPSPSAFAELPIPTARSLLVPGEGLTDDDRGDPSPRLEELRVEDLDGDGRLEALARVRYVDAPRCGLGSVELARAFAVDLETARLQLALTTDEIPRAEVAPAFRGELARRGTELVYERRLCRWSEPTRERICGTPREFRLALERRADRWIPEPPAPFDEAALEGERFRSERWERAQEPRPCGHR
ncbi:MAG TPA: hypothetical protein RMH99_32570 [Sandaracinaceae bacterium LLY-WYZ-13_1]|nr:hypothetical protein [Sandaracinaceae bacterium LLY-WYZ-13_1]